MDAKSARRYGKRVGAITGGVLALGIWSASAGVAQNLYDETPPPTVRGVDVTPRPQVLGEEIGRGEALPVTGGDLAALAGLGVVAVGAGGVLVRRGRNAER
jgi:LPXTG-motif cell wall-anchored protein